MPLLPRFRLPATFPSALFVVLLFTGTSVLQLAAPASALAQADDPAAHDGAKAASAKDNNATPAAQSPSYLAWLFHALGWIYTVAFLAISFTFLAAVVLNAMAARRTTLIPPRLVSTFEEHLNEKRYHEAYELVKSDESFVGMMLATGMGKLAGGYNQALAAMQRTGESEALRIEHRLSYIALIGTIAPLVGLLGTVDKMIAIAQTASARPEELSDGVAAALVRTLVGLLLAIPAVVAYNLLKNRLGRLIHEAGALAEGLISRFDTSKT